MQSYYSAIKQYSWIVLVCTVLASAIGFFITEVEPIAFQASATLLVEAGAPGTGVNPMNSYIDSNRSLVEASNYAEEIQSYEVIDFVYMSNPEIKEHGYSADYLLLHTTTTTSTSSATVTITVSCANSVDAVLLANDVATSFTMYVQKKTQQRLDTLRVDLQEQIDTYRKQSIEIERQILALGANNTADPRYGVYTSDREEINRTIDLLQGQLVQLPTTVIGDVSVIRGATDGTVISSSKKTVTIAATGGVGLLVGILVMFFIIFLDNRLRSEDQVREKLGLAYLGSLSTKQELKSHPIQLTSSTIHELTDICASLFLTGVLADERRTPRGAVLLITSAQVAEGKTIVASALAVNLARSGSTVLVVDGNLHHPATHLAFEQAVKGLGLGGLLKGMNEQLIDKAVLRTKVPNVWLLPGQSSIDESALLLEQRFPFILNQLRKKVDFVIIDGPALLSGADACILASMADGVALVVDSRYNKLPLLLRAKEVLCSLTQTPTGIIINFLSNKRYNHYYATKFPKVKKAYMAPDDKFQDTNNRSAKNQRDGTSSINGNYSGLLTTFGGSQQKET